MSKLIELSEKIVKAKKELQDEIQQAGKEEFFEEFKPIFEKFPTLRNFSWPQYRPYFNDGDTCYFSVHSDPYRIKVAFDTDEYGISESDEDDGEGQDDTLDLRKEVRKYISEVLQKIDEDIFEDVFGDHAEITVHRDGTMDIDGYDHD